MEPRLAPVDLVSPRGMKVTFSSRSLLSQDSARSRLASSDSTKSFATTLTNKSRPGWGCGKKPDSGGLWRLPGHLHPDGDAYDSAEAVARAERQTHRSKAIAGAWGSRKGLDKSGSGKDEDLLCGNSAMNKRSLHGMCGLLDPVSEKGYKRIGTFPEGRWIMSGGRPRLQGATDADDFSEAPGVELRSRASISRNSPKFGSIVSNRAGGTATAKISIVDRQSVVLNSGRTSQRFLGRSSTRRSDLSNSDKRRSTVQSRKSHMSQISEDEDNYRRSIGHQVRDSLEDVDNFPEIDQILAPLDIEENFAFAAFPRQLREDPSLQVLVRDKPDVQALSSLRAKANPFEKQPSKVIVKEEMQDGLSQENQTQKVRRKQDAPARKKLALASKQAHHRARQSLRRLRERLVESSWEAFGPDMWKMFEAQPDNKSMAEKKHKLSIAKHMAKRIFNEKLEKMQTQCQDPSLGALMEEEDEDEDEFLMEDLGPLRKRMSSVQEDLHGDEDDD